jgi:hypothetical protein
VPFLETPGFCAHSAGAKTGQTDDQNVLRGPVTAFYEVIFSLIESANMSGKEQFTDR